MSVSYRPSISLKDGHLAEEQRCYDFSIYYDFDYGHNGSDNCMESNLLKIIMRIITVIQYKTLMNFSVQLMRSATIWGWDSLYGIPETKI